jgi:hypothetical protein
MKKIALISLFACVFYTSCRNNEEKPKTEAVVTKDPVEFFGDTITETGAVPATGLVASLKGKDSLRVKLTARIEEVCQKKGCWMDISLGSGQTMKVRFKDYGFFVPKDAAGKTAVFEGLAYTDTIPVNELRHYAEDEGRSKAEIEKITQPEVSISFEAHGVLIKK